MCSSSIPASRLRATSPISRARITAPSGSCRNAPSGRAGSSAASAPAVSSCAVSWRITSAARRTPSRASAPDHSTSSIGRAVGAHPLRLDIVGDALRGRAPGPSFTPVGTRAASANTQSSEGDQSSGRVREVSLCPAVRRAGRATRHPPAGARMPPPRRPRTPRPCRGVTVTLSPNGREVVGGDRGRHLVGVDGGDPRARAPPAPARRRRSRSRGPRRASCRRRGSARRGGRRPRVGSPAPGRRG